MNKEITSSIQVGYWKNSSVVIKWFRNLENNSSSLVIIFDIQDFYSSILLSAFNRAIEFGKEISNSLNDENSMIMITRETLLFSDGEAWVKKMKRMLSMYPWASTMEQRCASWLAPIY